MNQKQHILLAGGTGLIGKHLSGLLEKNGFHVFHLTRNPSQENHIWWDPYKRQIDANKLAHIEVLVNLTGENIGTKNWTRKRKKELEFSRIESTAFLRELAPKMPRLNYYIGASGVNCYDLSKQLIFSEEDSFGDDYLSQLVRKWEMASNEFNDICPVLKLRISMVLSPQGGSLQTMKKPILLGLGSPLGNGNQRHPWIHIEDLSRIFLFAIEKKLTGVYHAVGNCDTNREMMRKLARQLGRPFFLPAVPSIILKSILGERSMLVLSDLQVSNKKLKNTGFEFKFEDLEKALNHLFPKN